MNPIKYSELIQNDVGNEFEVLAKTLKTIKGNYDGLAKSVNEQTARLAEGLKALNPATPEGQAALIAYTRKIEELEKKVKSLEAAQKQYKQTQKEINDLDAQAIRHKIEHKEAVKQLTDQVKAEYAQEKLTEEEMARLSKQAEVQKMSYNELSQAYNRLKSQINEMTAATEDETKAREKLSATARQVYEQMNKLQQSTGKYTLQVGNYAKSWNGLNIAFQQITREVPNMAMGFNTFFLAISNNIPILADQIKLAGDKYKADMKNIEAMKLEGALQEDIDKAMKDAIPVGKQILSSLFSWQTAMMVGVTLLTMFGGKMIEHISNWIKARRGVDDVVDSLGLYNKALSDTSMEGAKASATINLLYKEATDLNASMEDRLGAVQDLKNLYPDVFEGLETEAILAGEAREQYEMLSESIYKTAMAEAARNKIADVASREIEQRLRQQELNRKAIEQGYLGANDMASFMNSFSVDVDNPELSGGAVLNKAQKDIVKEYQDVEKALETIMAERDAIQKMMEDNDLFGFLKGNASGGRKGSTKAETVDDLYWEAMTSIIGGMNAGLQKEIADLTATYAQQQESFKEKEAELIALLQSSDEAIASEAEKQLKNLQVLVASAENNYQAERAALVQKMLEGYAEEVADEGNIEEQVKKRIETELKVERELMTSEMYMLFEQKKITQEELNEKLARINNDYWYAYAQQLKAMGDIQGYNEAMGRIKENTDSEEEGPFAKWLKDHGVSRKYLKDLERAAKLTIGYIGDIIDAYHELAEAAVKAAEKQVEAAQKVYEAELGAYENGYANNVEYARKELALRKEQLAKAAEQEKKYAKMQQQVETAEQAVTLASTIAYLFRDATKATGLLGIPLAIAASATMLAAFTASKVMVARAARAKDSIEYGEGMHEYLDYGGSHASGNDIDFGVGKDGRRRRVERGEMVAVFNKRNTDKYGATALGNLVDSINKGTFEQEYLGIFGGASGGNGVIVMNNFPSSVSDDISAIRKSTENQRYVAGNGTIVEKYRNRTRIIHLN